MKLESMKLSIIILSYKDVCNRNKFSRGFPISKTSGNLRKLWKPHDLETYVGLVQFAKLRAGCYLYIKKSSLHNAYYFHMPDLWKKNTFSPTFPIFLVVFYSIIFAFFILLFFLFWMFYLHFLWLFFSLFFF